MAQRTKFMTLPPELRERVYEYIALSHITRRIQTVRHGEYKTTTSPITATCRLIHNEYEDVARKSMTKLEFTATDLDFHTIIDYFHRRVDAKYLSMLQTNKATILINLHHHHSSKLNNIADFYTWALFLIDVNLEATYHANDATWIEIFEAADPELKERCVVDGSSSQEVKENIEEVRSLAGGLTGRCGVRIRGLVGSCRRDGMRRLRGVEGEDW